MKNSKAICQRIASERRRKRLKRDWKCEEKLNINMLRKINPNIKTANGKKKKKTPSAL